MKDSTQVKQLLLQSYKIRDSLHSNEGIVYSKINMGEYYLFKKDTAVALPFLKAGYALAKKSKLNYPVLYCLKLLAQNDIKEKTLYTNTFFKEDDSIKEIEQKTRSKFARIAFETDQVEEKNEILSKRIFYIILSVLAISGFMLGLFYIYKLRVKNRELKAAKEQQKANETIFELIMKQQFETENARKQERERIAMELHDGVVNSIFTTRFNLGQLPTKDEDKRTLLVNQLQIATDEIRRISHALSNNLGVEDNNLPNLLTKLVADQKNESNTQFDLTIDKYIDWSVFNSEYQINIYRIIQECLQNVNKYAKAQKCFVMILKTNDKITLRIWDDGIGFDAENIKYGIGLKNIKKRTQSMNGELKITSIQREGSSIEVII